MVISAQTQAAQQVTRVITLQIQENVVECIGQFKVHADQVMIAHQNQPGMAAKAKERFLQSHVAKLFGAYKITILIQHQQAIYLTTAFLHIDQVGKIGNVLFR